MKTHKWIGQAVATVTPLIFAISFSTQQSAKEVDQKETGSISKEFSTMLKRAPTAVAGVYRWKYNHSEGYTFLEVLDDDLIHVEFGSGGGPQPGQHTIYTSPMVFKNDYQGPTSLNVTDNNNRIETAEIVVQATESGRCLRLTHLTKGELTTVCGDTLNQDKKTIGIKRSSMNNVYGLGQHFWSLGSSDGDWIGMTKATDNQHGNAFAGYYGGANSQIQFPIYFALGGNNTAYGMFLDNVYKHDWDFQGNWWHSSMYGEHVRFFIMAGDSIQDVRSDYLELTGKPPVPPKKAFGLWISEFGFDNWDEIDCKLYGESKWNSWVDCENSDPNKKYLQHDGSLRKNGFPVDGVVLDLQWFGAVNAGDGNSSMGGLNWDTEGSPHNTFDPFFPDPDSKIQQYADDHIGVIAIEESYVAEEQWSFKQMANRGALVRWGCGGPFWTNSNWMGKVGMIDWSNENSRNWWHDTLRQNNLVNKGIIGHWTDLGEPERWTNNGCYSGVEPDKHNHSDIHNIYNLLWHQSIYEGYVRHQRLGNKDAQRRPFLLARAGAPGIQRYGAAMWSGDIAGRLDVLASHMRAAMHMSFSGVDYYGSDIGGFWRRAVYSDSANQGQDPSEHWMVTQWFANSSWFDVPVRTHTYNCGFKQLNVGSVSCPYEVSPAGVGERNSNLHNIRQRYELTPYYYSLAHRAYLYAEPVFPAIVMNYPDDPTFKTMGHERMIGKDLLVGIVMGYGQQNRDIFFPAGGWYNYHTNQWINSVGNGFKTTEPVFRDGVFRLPAFAKAGAIIPLMHVDDQTKDVFGHRKDGSARNELIAKIYIDENNLSTEYEFTVYEDDGSTVNGYDDDNRPLYLVRTTRLSQTLGAETLTVTIDAVAGDTVDGLPDTRNNELRIVTHNKQAQLVNLNDQPLPQKTFAQFYANNNTSGWVNINGNEILVRTGPTHVSTTKRVSVTFDDSPCEGPDCPCERPNCPCTGDDCPPTQRTLIFIEGLTQDGQELFLRGGIDHGYARANLGFDCDTESEKFKCAIQIEHRLFVDDPQRANDNYIDWHGAEPGQGNVEGTPLAWTTNSWPNDWGARKTVDVDGFGETPLNRWGHHYWMLDINMDCSQTVNGWFEVKSYISNGPGWEPDVSQSGAPYSSENHFAKCGKLNVFKRGVSSPVTIENL